MARKARAFDIWKEMKPASLRRLALAVFLMFGILGPLTILMESEIQLLQWSFVVVQIIASGGMAASIILFARKRWWVMVFIIVFWVLILGLNSGGIGFIFNDDGMKVQLNGFNKLATSIQKTEPLVLQPDELDAIYTQRGQVGLIAIAMLAFGYAMFIKVIRAEISQRSRLETEVKIAQDIQQSLLPETSLLTSWYSIAGIAVPASEVGGDFFDIIQLAEDKVAIAIADVTGHGVGAGILSAMTKSALHSQLQHDHDPLSVLTNLNATLAQLSDEKTFVTFAYVVLDKSSNTIHYATAGHPPIFHIQQGRNAVTQLRTINLALGLKKGIQFATSKTAFISGDRLLLYTDGVLEATNKHEEQFGSERLQHIILSSHEKPEKVHERIIANLQEFCGTATFTDDVSLVCISLT